MKLCFAVCFVAAFLTLSTACAQERTGVQDTTLGLLHRHDPETVLNNPIAILPFSFALAAADDAPLPSLYHSFAGTPQSFNWNNQEKIDLTAPLKLQLMGAEKERPWRISLGAAGTAGALYIAYRHIKKYGLK